jgi:O-antigen/teichoic acid export membrane protein
VVTEVPTPVAGEATSGLGLRREVVSGTLWTTGASTGAQVVAFVVTAILAHLLAPSEFGLISMVLVFTGFAGLFVDMGLGAAVIQRDQLEERHLSSVFWVNVAAGFVLAGVMAALAPALSALYGEPRLIRLTFAISGNFVIASVVAVQVALLIRRLAFRRLAIIDMSATFVSGVVAVTAAVLGLGVWSLVAQALTLSSTRALLLWITSDWRPRRILERGAIHDLWGFSSNLAGFNALNYWIRNADNFLVGRFVGPAGLGIYGRAYNLMLMPLTQISWVLSRVMFPVLSRMQKDTARVKQAYLRAIGVIGLVTFPIVTGLFAVAEPFVLTVFGPKWEAMVPIVQILCLAGLSQSVGTTTGWIYQSQGRTDWMFRWGLASGAVTLVAFGIGIVWGVKGIAIAFAVRTVLLTYFNFSIPGKLIDLRFREVVSALRGVLVAALVMSGCVLLLGLALPESWPDSARLAAEVAFGALLYLGLTAGFRVQPYRELKDIVRDDLRRRRAQSEMHAAAGALESK